MSETAKTFVGTYTSTQTLSNPATDNPALVTGTISVSSTNQYAAGLNGATGFGWTVTNLGTVQSLGNQGIGIRLHTGGVVTNGTAGSGAALISGSDLGVDITGGAGTVTNFAVIQGIGGDGIYLGQGGNVTNQAGGVITSGLNAISVHAAPATIDNFGTISTSSGAKGEAIYLLGGGTVTNEIGAVLSGAVPGVPAVNGTGGYTGVIKAHVQRATVFNLGTIINSNNSGGVNLNAGGLLVNGSTSINSALINAVQHGVYMGGTSGVPIPGAVGTVANYGTIQNSSNTGNGIQFNAGGSVLNHGLISSPRNGIAIENAPGTIDNFGSIVSTAPQTATGGGGIYLGGGGAITNEASGTITSVRNGVNISNSAAMLANAGLIQNSGTNAAVYSRAGGIVTNLATGLIQGPRNAISFNDTVGTTISFGTVDNAGTIQSTGATAGAGVNFGQGGVLTNEAGALITARTGVNLGTGDSTIVNFGTIIGSSGISIHFGSGNDQLVIESGSQLQGAVGNFHPGDTFDLPFLPYTPGGSATLGANNLLQISENGSTFAIQLDPTQGDLSRDFFELVPDSNSGTLVTAVPAPPPSQSPAVLNDFAWAQGWGGPDNPRFTTDMNGDGNSDYVGFGYSATFIAYGGTFGDGQGQTGPGFSNAVAAVQDFGTSEGYNAQVQRGAAPTGSGFGDSIYGQGFAGVYWYAATGETQTLDAAGNPYPVLQYQPTPNFYGNFGSQQGWTPANGFQILKTTAADSYASILGFGDAGIVVGPQAFAPNATAANSYVIPLAAGNSSGWDQRVDIRTFSDVGGKPIDLNGDGIVDFVGMGPQGLAFAFGNQNGPGGFYQLGPLQLAQINGPNDDLGEAQGWSNATTLRYVVADPKTGFDNILAFGDAGVEVAMGQDPATHNGQPFGQLYLAMPDFGANQGWSVQQTPRIVGDVNGDGIPDIVGFGASSTFVALGSRDSSGNLHFALAPNETIGDFGYTEGWSGSNPQTVRALADFKTGGTTHSDLVLSGAANTQVWQFV